MKTSKPEGENQKKDDHVRLFPLLQQDGTLGIGIAVSIAQIVKICLAVV